MNTTDKPTLASIEQLCARFDGEAATLEEAIANLEADLDAVKKKHLRIVKRQAAVVAGCEAELQSAVEAAPDLFEKPRSITLHGVKVGYNMSNGRLEYQDADSVVKLIKRYRGDDVELLIHTSEEPNKDALRKLPAVDLAKLGCSIAGAGDQVIVRRVAGDVEKLVKKLMEKMVEAMVANPE